MARVIVHIDLNAFFASVEIIKDPSLKGKPMIVGGKFKRGVVSTASYEARKFGIHAGMPIGMAYNLCPSLINKDVDMKEYKRYSMMFFDIIKEKLGEKMEIASIDECFVDLSENYQKIGNVEKYLRDIQKYIYDTLGLGCSIGIAPNKFLAKMASDMQKPMGLTILRKKDIEDKLWPLEIEKMYGVGKKTAPRLREKGINTIGDLAKCTDNYEVELMLGKSYYSLYNWANGIDKNEVIDWEVDAKSIGNSTTFINDIKEIDEVKIELMILAKNVSKRIINVSSLAFGVGIVIKFSDFTLINRSCTYSSPVCNDDEIYLKSLKLFEDNYDRKKPIRLLGITLFDIHEKSKVLKQLNIFDIEISKDSTNDIINKLNELMGKKVFVKAKEVGGVSD